MSNLFLKIKQRLGWIPSGLCKIAPVLVVIFILEITLAPFLPRLLPRSWYLDSYLRQEAIQEIKDFLEGRLCVEPDDLRGWRNRAGCSSGKIEYDKFGARSSRFIPGPNPFSGRLTKVILLGDSLVHGWNQVTNQETIAAFLNGCGLEAMNLGCVSYGLDQTSLAMEKALARYKPDVVIVGLESGAEELIGCHFQPFIRRTEICVPFLKPRYIFTTGQLQLQVPKFRKLLTGIPNNAEFYNFLEKNDPYYKNFTHYQYVASTPLIGFFDLMGQKVNTRLGRMTGFNYPVERWLQIENFNLLKAIIIKTVRVAAREDACLIYLLFPGKDLLRHNDRANYQQLAAFFAEKGIRYVDVLNELEKHGSPHKYLIDGFHLNVEGNRIIARSLARTIEGEIKEGPVQNREKSGSKPITVRIDRDRGCPLRGSR